MMRSISLRCASEKFSARDAAGNIMRAAAAAAASRRECMVIVLDPLWQRVGSKSSKFVFKASKPNFSGLGFQLLVSKSSFPTLIQAWFEAWFQARFQVWFKAWFLTVRFAPGVGGRGWGRPCPGRGRGRGRGLWGGGRAGAGS